MKWNKRGLIIAPEDSRIPVWGRKRIMLPTPFDLGNNVIRIFVGLCNEDNIGRVGFIDVNKNNPAEILDIGQTPALDPGGRNDFDEYGAVPTCVLPTDGKLLLYYGGFSRDQANPYYMFEGLAESYDNGATFKKISDGPVLEKTDLERFFRVGSFVMQDAGKWKMWYIGGNSWRKVADKLMPVYKCNYLESGNPVEWGDDFRNCLDFNTDEEHGFSRPWILKEDQGYRMFYSIRKINKGYVPGYAVSRDGLVWTRRDSEVGMDLSDEGWDSKMITYPAIFKTASKTYLFYNGNNNGEGGLGYAELEHNTFDAL